MIEKSEATSRMIRRNSNVSCTLRTMCHRIVWAMRETQFRPGKRPTTDPCPWCLGKLLLLVHISKTEQSPAWGLRACPTMPILSRLLLYVINIFLLQNVLVLLSCMHSPSCKWWTLQLIVVWWIIDAEDIWHLFTEPWKEWCLKGALW